MYILWYVGVSGWTHSDLWKLLYVLMHWLVLAFAYPGPNLLLLSGAFLVVSQQVDRVPASS